ncbi:glycosyltransferase family 4 protein [Botrimarina mediterranea]|uniref:Capsular glucan synthase n=1 Tax=Botrimarina mediterranea TaxID=2528022 RepID=A0A518KBF3_9BACT|nr:glycosyltransferase family 4 protein [Botrimarina mediterranea]QDV75120.1 Capsular glucan synthase [Botrimarina mediterranea]QDV79765.1 Capsular glucan synthase [Planctomycetes bacterium K2D]
MSLSKGESGHDSLLGVDVNDNRTDDVPLSRERHAEPRQTYRVFNKLAPADAKILLGALREARAEADRIRRIGADLYHAQNTGCETSPIAARWAGIPIVLGTFHTDSTYDLDRQRDGWGHRLIERYSNRCLHHAIAVSEATRHDWMRRTGIRGDRVTTIHNGVCPETYRRRRSQAAARAELGLPADRLLIGAVGRLDRAKGHADLIDAFARIATTKQEADLVIAGAGPLREELASRSERLGVASRVHFLGQVSEVSLAYDALDVYAMPSLCEALPFALLEAMAHGLPCVTSRAGGMPEVVVDGQTGRLVATGDVEALATALTNLIGAEELRRDYGAAGRARVEKHFTERQMVEQTLRVYDQLVEQRLTKQRSGS